VPGIGTEAVAIGKRRFWGVEIIAGFLLQNWALEIPVFIHKGMPLLRDKMEHSIENG
jgi:hypothetical protein